MTINDIEQYQQREHLYKQAASTVYKRYYPALQRIEEVIDSNYGEATRSQRQQYAFLATMAASYCADRVMVPELVLKAKQALAALTLEELLNTFPLRKCYSNKYGVINYQKSKAALKRYCMQYRFEEIDDHINSILHRYTNDHIDKLLEQEAAATLDLRRLMFLA